MEWATILAHDVIVKLKKTEGAQWWRAKFVIMSGAGFVDMRKQPGFIGLQDRQVCARILIMGFLALMNRIEIEFQDW